jgi:hypothetical protein
VRVRVVVSTVSGHLPERRLIQQLIRDRCLAVMNVLCDLGAGVSNGAMVAAEAPDRLFVTEDLGAGEPLLKGLC